MTGGTSGIGLEAAKARSRAEQGAERAAAVAAAAAAAAARRFAASDHVTLLLPCCE